MGRYKVEVIKSVTGMRLYRLGSLDVTCGFNWLISVYWSHWGFEIYRSQQWPMFSDTRTLGLAVHGWQVKVWLGQLSCYVSLERLQKRAGRTLWLSNADVWPKIINA